MDTYAELVRHITLPDMLCVRQQFARPQEPDVPSAIKRELQPLQARIRPGMRVAIACGSRGIRNLAIIMRETARFCIEQGAFPFIFPAMGSHAGATAQGQKALLEGYGVTQDACGCPIRSSMETVEIGQLDGFGPVVVDQYAAQADAIIVVNRIKAHTAFQGPYESGLMKMLTIGMGKHAGAKAVHRKGFGEMHHLVSEIGKLVLAHTNVICGIGIIENAYEETAYIRAIPAEKIPQEEPRLLREAKQLMGRLLFSQADVLVVGQIGKDISGEGADPNVTGRFPTPYATGGLNAFRRVCLGISAASHGCAYGVGLFDSIPKRMFDAIDWNTGYINAITNTVLHATNIPMVMPTGYDAIAVALYSCNRADFQAPRLIYIEDTMHLEKVYISEAMRGEAEAHPDIEIVETAAPFRFDTDGRLYMIEQASAL